jgi:Transposase
MNASKEHPQMTAGLDIGDKYSYLCLIDQESAEVVEEGRLRTTPEALRRRFASEQPLRIAMEAGTHSPWVSRVLEECGHEVLVANARKTRLIYANKRKTDEIDAENLARLARLDPKLLYPLKHRGEESQAHMALMRSRQVLVGARTQLVNPGYEEQSSPSGPACPSARPGASTTEHPGTSPRRFWRPSDPSWSRDRLANTAHQGLRAPAGGDRQGALPTRNRALAPGGGSRTAHGAYVRAYPGGPLPLRKEPQCRSIPGACARQRQVGR